MNPVAASRCFAVAIALLAGPAFADYTIAPVGGDITGAQLSADLAAGDVTLVAASGDVVVSDVVTWNAATTLTLNAPGSIRVRAPIIVRHAGGGLALNYGGTAGDAGATPAAGTDYLVDAPVDFTAGTGGRFGVNGDAYALVHDVDALQAMREDLAGRYALARDVDARATRSWNDGAGFEPVGVSYFLGTPFSGTLAGLGHVVRGLFVDRPDATQGGGLFGGIGSNTGGASVVDLGLHDVDVAGPGAAGLVGYARNSRLDRVWVSGRVAGVGPGGLAASIDGSSVRRSWAEVQVQTQDGSTVGGLVGYAANSSIAQSWAGGSVTVEAGDAGVSVGGLLGSAYLSSVSQSYATASVTVNGTGALYVGGLVGIDGGSVNQCWASGRVSATGGSSPHAGGLVGFVDFEQSAADSYWDNDSTGQANGVGGTNFGTISNVLAVSSQSGAAYVQGGYGLFDFAATWYLIGGQTRPFLRSEYSTLVRNAHQLQLMALDRSARYVLGAPVDAAETGRNDGSAAAAAGMWTRAGFAPIGDYPNVVAGSLDGRNHVVRGFSVDRPDYPYIGLFGFLDHGTVENLGFDGGRIRGNSDVGAFAGYNNGTVRNSYSTAEVQGAAAVGGLVGANTGYVIDAYAAGDVGGIDRIGGLVGDNYGIVDDSYASGRVSGATALGGLAGHNANAIDDSFYATTDAVGDPINNGGDGSGAWSGNADGTAQTLAQLQTLSTFADAGWSISDAGGDGSAWRLYGGHVTPLLRSFLAPLAVIAADASKPWDGVPWSGGNGASYVPAWYDADLLGGALDYGGSAQGAVAPGTYAITPIGLYSSQPGYDVIAVDGMLTIVGSASTALALAQAAPPYVTYGQVVDYVVTLSNSGSATAKGYAVHASFGGGADVGATTWQCIAGSVDAICAAAGNGPIDDSVTVPPGVSMTWLIHVPVATATQAGTLDFEFSAEGLDPVVDTATIVLFRDGFDGAGQ